MLRARPPCVTSRPSRPVAPSVALFFCDGAQLSLAFVLNVLLVVHRGLIRVLKIRAGR